MIRIWCHVLQQRPCSICDATARAGAARRGVQSLGAAVSCCCGTLRCCSAALVSGSPKPCPVVRRHRSRLAYCLYAQRNQSAATACAQRGFEGAITEVCELPSASVSVTICFVKLGDERASGDTWGTHVSCWKKWGV